MELTQKNFFVYLSTKQHQQYLTDHPYPKYFDQRKQVVPLVETLVMQIDQFLMVLRVHQPIFLPLSV